MLLAWLESPYSVDGVGCSFLFSLSITILLLSFNAEISSALFDLSEEELMMDIVLELLAWLTSSRLKNPVEVVLWNGVVLVVAVVLETLLDLGILLLPWG